MADSDRIVVLNVDDYEAGRYATSRVLRQAGYEVVEAANGEDALRMAEQHPDLVVLDVNLPDVNGFEVCRRLKEHPDTAGIPVLYLSAAYRGAEDRVQGLELGADGYLTQPVDPRELVATVNALLRSRHIREAVQRSEQRFRSLMTATSDILWTTSAEGEFVSEQPDWASFTGQTPEQYLGRGWLNAVHPADRLHSLPVWERALEERALYEVEQRVRHHNGEYRYMLVRAVPVLEPDGSVREWVGASTDITEQRVAQMELWERNERLQLLSDAANRLLLTDDPREYMERLLRQLSTYLELEIYLNYLADEPSGELVLNVFHGIPPEVADTIRRAAPGETVSGDVALHREAMVAENVQHSMDPRLARFQELGVTAYACYPLVSHDRLIGTLSFGTRARTHFDEDELSLMQTIGDQVAVAVERSRLIEELQERARALEEANRAKSDFLATMSHELRTPLNAMIGYTDLLMMGVPEPIPAPSRQQVERIRSAATHLTQLIEEVLTHARIEAGRDELHMLRVRLSDVVDEVVALVEPLARQEGLGFAVELSNAPGEVETDPRKVRQILLNLLGNAVKFTDQGEIGLAVSTEDGQLVLRVRDTGIGIAAENLGKVFEPFWQVDGTKTRRVGGTGLGLGVVQQLAERLGGSVEVSSAEAEGSTFTVRLPLHPRLEPDSAPD